MNRVDTTGAAPAKLAGEAELPPAAAWSATPRLADAPSSRFEEPRGPAPRVAPPQSSSRAATIAGVRSTTHRAQTMGNATGALALLLGLGLPPHALVAQTSAPDGAVPTTAAGTSVSPGSSGGGGSGPAVSPPALSDPGYVPGSQCEAVPPAQVFTTAAPHKILVTFPRGPKELPEGFADGVGRSLQATLTRYFQRIDGGALAAAGKLEAGGIEVAYLPCVARNHRVARAVGRSLQADVVIWGQTGCTGKREECWAGLEHGLEAAVEAVRSATPLGPGLETLVAGAPPDGLATDVSRSERLPRTGWLSLTLSLTQEPLRREVVGSVEQWTELSEIQDLTLPWLATDGQGALFHAGAGLLAQKSLAHEGAARFFELAATSIPQGRDHRSGLIRLAGIHRLLTEPTRSPADATGTRALSPGELMLEAAERVCSRRDNTCRAAALSALAWSQDRGGLRAESLATYRRALVLREKSGSSGLTAVTLNNVGILLVANGEYRQALAGFQQALGLSQRAGDLELESATWNNLGELRLRLEEPRPALEAFTRALPLAQKVQNLRQEARTLINLGTAHLRTGQLDPAGVALEQGIPKARAQGDISQEVRGLVAMAEVNLARGRKGPALEGLRDALALSRQRGLKETEGVCLAQLARVYASLGEREKALEHFLLALPLIQQRGDVAWEASVTHEIARLYREQGELEAALDYHQRSIPLIQRTGDKEWLSAKFNEIGQLYATQGKPAEALTSYQQALANLPGGGDLPWASSMLVSMADIYSARAEPDLALAHYARALPLIQRARDGAWEASVLERMAHIHQDRSQHKQALVRYEQALPLIRETGNPAWEGGVLEQISRVHFELGDEAKGQAYAEKASKLLR